MTTDERPHCAMLTCFCPVCEDEDDPPECVRQAEEEREAMRRLCYESQGGWGE